MENAMKLSVPLKVEVFLYTEIMAIFIISAAVPCIADYSQIELRVLAHMSNDEIMVKAFNEDSDIHTICQKEFLLIV